MSKAFTRVNLNSPFTNLPVPFTTQEPGIATTTPLLAQNAAECCTTSVKMVRKLPKNAKKHHSQ